jgi:putative DNA primase/helicase
MNRINSKSKFSEPLSKTVERLVDQNGGWLNVIGRMTSTFNPALSKVGKLTDCPFPERHSRDGGKEDFRFSDNPKYEGRAICTCMQDKGMSAIELLIEDGIGEDFTKCLLKIHQALSPESSGEYVRKESAPQVARPAYNRLTDKDVAWRKAKLDLIARDLVSPFHPSAAPLRAYFNKRGIPLNENILDVLFHPALEYWVNSDTDKDQKILVGTFPAIVSVFRTVDGVMVNFHRIFITLEGDKAPVSKVKKICAPLPKFSGSSITVATTLGRVLHVTEGVEKAWAIHLATGESVKAAYSCSSLPKLHVDKAKYDSVVIWSDCDPVNPKRNRKSGDGQYFAWELARRLHLEEGFDVTFLMPDGIPANVKGRDWEDVIVQEGVLDLKGAYTRFQTLKMFAVKGGVHKQHSRAA